MAGEDGFVDISVEQDGGLLKKILVEGSGDEKPPSGSEVKVHYVGTLQEDGSKFDSSRDRGQQFQFDVGVGQVIKGWDVGICSMKRGEKAILRARSDYAYGDHGSPPKIPPKATLDFEVELFSWREKVKEPFQMTPEERSAYASQQKDLGNAAFGKQDWQAAIEAYDEGARYITHGQGDGGHGHGHSHSHGGAPCHGDHGGGDEVELSEEDKKLALALLCNGAMAKLKVGEPELAKFDCGKALELDPNNVKALFRRAKAKVAVGEFDAAMEDAARVLELDAGNKEAELLKRQAENEKKKQKQKEKAMFSKMFG
eukprot:TRINITY_DN37923_c0_g1_i1.p2 TRINITY_DN37923_c0_g1~~TRINITY_DN37923_c0_g1_i1.p2  ORF type:complete len:313 (+),score=118.31 TRINITY_DN37923_c0_g1_i1:47-985(+)